MPGFQYRYRAPRNTPEERGGKPPVYTRTVENEHAMIIERDVTIADCATASTSTPMSFAPPTRQPGAADHRLDALRQACAVRPEALPQCRREGRAHLRIHRVRGARSDFLGAQRLRHHQRRHARHLVFGRHRALISRPKRRRISTTLIEWAGTQPWSNGKVGLSGVSYLAQLQWRVAELQPAASCRDQSVGRLDRHLSRSRDAMAAFPRPISGRTLWNRWGASKTAIEDLEAETKEHPLFDDFWRSQGGGLLEYHRAGLRGRELDRPGPALRAAPSRASSTSRPSRNGSRVHGRKKWAHYYVPENVRKLQPSSTISSRAPTTS